MEALPAQAEFWMPREGDAVTDDVTLDDVARTSGVSRATASRALNGRNGVREDVRERVRAAAGDLGYRPNRSARNLAGGRSSVIGLVLGSVEIRHDVYAASLIQAMAAAADRHDEGLMLLVPSDEPSLVVRRMLSDGLVDGVIISVVALGDQWIEELLDARVSTVLVGAHPRRSDVPVIDVENLESSAAMVGHLLDSGCDRVATVTGPLDRVDATRRLEGYRLAHERRGFDIDPDLIIESDFTRRSAYDLADDLFARSPDGLFAANDETALGVMRRAAERGVSIPDEFSVAGFDGTSLAEPFESRLSTVEQPFEELAMTAVGALISLIDGEAVPAEQLVTPQLHFDASTGPVGEP